MTDSVASYLKASDPLHGFNNRQILFVLYVSFPALHARFLEGVA